jgi:hypothetical protein
MRILSWGLVCAVLACSSTTDGRIGNSLIIKSMSARLLPHIKHKVTLRGGADDLDWLDVDDTKQDVDNQVIEITTGPCGDEHDDGRSFLEDGSLPDVENHERQQIGLPVFGTPDVEGRYDVLLHVYDLTLGGVRNVSAMYPDEPKIHGIWQLGICVHGREWTYCAYKGAFALCCMLPVGTCESAQAGKAA